MKINSTLSSVNNVTCGVPQGSVLGPLLYILFTNDIFSLSNSNCKLLSFADDTSITVWSSNYKDLFVLANNLMESVYKWLSANKLSLNINKTKFICYNWSNIQSSDDATKISLHSFHCNAQICSCPSIESVDRYKYLGVIIDKQLSWKPHVEYLLGKLRFGLLIIYRLRKSFSVRLLRLVYFSFFQSYLQYCLVAYGNAFASLLVPIEVLQKKCVRLIANQSYTSASLPIFQKLNILSFKSLFIYRTLLYVKKHYYSLSLRQCMSTRHINFINSKKYNTTRGQRCLSFRTVSLLNALGSNFDITNCTKAILKKESVKIMNQNIIV